MLKSVREPRSAHFHSLQHTGVSQLAHYVLDVKDASLIQRVGLNAPHVVRLREIDIDHEVLEFTSEPRADRVDFAQVLSLLPSHRGKPP